MLRSFIKLGIVTMCVVLVAAACERQPRPFPSGDGALRASQDTLRFDTLFSGVTSTTAWMRIYNASNDPLCIDSLALASRGRSGFRVSIDALPWEESKQIYLPAGDSLFVFVEITPTWQHQATPQVILDELRFYTDNQQLNVVLQAYAWDALQWKSKIISSDTTLRAGIPYVIYDSLVVTPQATLRLEPGVQLYFHDAATLMVYGRIEAKGSLQQPVVFRGDRLDWAFDDFPYEWYPGQWTGIYLGSDSYDNVFEHAHIRGAYYGIISDSSSVDRLKLTVHNSQIFNMVYTNLYAINTQMRISNTVLANSGSYTVALIGGDAEFTHCTIANYQVLVTREENTPSLVVVNYTQDQHKKIHAYPLKKAAFYNSIVYGSRATELGLGLLEDYDRQLSFQACLLRNEDTLSTEFASEMLYNLDPCFVAVNKNYHYDFRLDSVSPAINQATRAFAELFPYDADGVFRLQDDVPDLGAYEYIFPKDSL